MEGLVDDLGPIGEMEVALVDWLVSLLWRVRRVLRAESGIFEMHEPTEDEDFLRKMGQRQPLTPSGRIAAAVARDAKDADTLTKLARYDTGLQRQFFRIKHELERMQAARKGETATLPRIQGQ